jgi:hypothetical protein
MAEARAKSGRGKTVATFPKGGGAGGGGGGGGGAFAGGFDMGGLIDPGLLREVMLQSLSQREMGFNEWMKGQRQRREMADLEMTLAGEEGRRKERDFYQRNIPEARRIPTRRGMGRTAGPSARAASGTMRAGISGQGGRGKLLPSTTQYASLYRLPTHSSMVGGGGLG